MMNLDDLFIDESSIYGDDGFDSYLEQVLTEWTVDSKKKKKLIQDVISKLESALNSNKKVKKDVTLFKKKSSLYSGSNARSIFDKKDIDENKRRKLAIGVYDFRDIYKEVYAYRQLNDIIDSVNSKLKGVKIYCTGEIDQQEMMWWGVLAGAVGVTCKLIMSGMEKNKVGVICIKIDKDVISEGTDFSDNVINDLFG